MCITVGTCKRHGRMHVSVRCTNKICLFLKRNKRPRFLHRLMHTNLLVQILEFTIAKGKRDIHGFHLPETGYRKDTCTSNYHLRASLNEQTRKQMISIKMCQSTCMIERKNAHSSFRCLLNLT
jgi:hypothetical protein